MLVGDNQGNNRQKAGELAHDKVFKALADATRRELLSLISKQPGINVTALCEGFPVSRFAIMKHLNILEAAGLVIRTRAGNSSVFEINKRAATEAIRKFLDEI